jgi:hypothetical protein
MAAKSAIGRIPLLPVEQIRTRSPAPEKSAKMGFWELFAWEIDGWVTSRPLSEMIPVLRRILDKQWGHNMGAGDVSSDVEANVISLLHYALDRAREVEALQAKLQENEATLRAALLAVVKH